MIVLDSDVPSAGPVLGLAGCQPTDHSLTTGLRKRS